MRKCKLRFQDDLLPQLPQPHRHGQLLHGDTIVDKGFRIIKIRIIRTTYGYTQAELAQRSGVGLRSIQMYEQRNKDINQASAETMYRLSKTLGCTMEDLIEK